MKIALITRLAPEAEVQYIPDPALTLPGRPMFYPDEGQGWVMRPCVAVRLNRLGKGVAPKFASRYYDSVAPALRLMLPGAVNQQILSGMDSSIACGEWMSPEGFAQLGPVTVSGVKIEYKISAEDIALAISAISRYTTVKMGDILLFGVDGPDVPATPHTLYEGVTEQGTSVIRAKLV